MTDRAVRPRTTVVTGARSGIGRATAALLAERGERVIGIDLGESAVTADLGTPAGRTFAIAEIRRLCPLGVDALIECHGVATTHDAPAILSINYFGAVALAEGLRPLLAAGRSPRVVIVSSNAALLTDDSALVEACLQGDEGGARIRAASAATDAAFVRQGGAYSASKRALTRWIRRTAPRPDWAGAGILLNGIAPGVVVTAMTMPLLATAEGRQLLDRVTPLAVAEPAQPADIALLLAFLASPDNRYLVGQVPFCDGGADVLLRGDAIV